MTKDERLMLEGALALLNAALAMSVDEEEGSSARFKAEREGRLSEGCDDGTHFA